MRRLILLFTLALTVAACSHGPAVRTEPIDRDLAVATFDSAWGLIHDSHFDVEFANGEWLTVREDLRPRAEAATTQDELRAVLREMIERVGLSHFGLLEEDAAEDFLAEETEEKNSDLGIHLRLIDDAILVAKVDVGSAARDGGVQPGWIVREVGDRNLEEILEGAKERIDAEMLDLLVWSMASRLLRGAEGEEISLVLENGEGETVEKTLTCRPSAGVVSQLGNLPPTRAHLFQDRLQEGGEDIGLIGFNIWLAPIAPEFNRAIDELRDTHGIVIDMRGNLGGIGGMAMGIAGHFLTERASLGTMITRDSQLEFRANPRRTNSQGQRVEPFSGPVAILIDPLSLSTSEIFAGGMQAIGRARVFGETSAGMALPSRLNELPNGDVLQYAFADFVDPDGVRLEGRGVVPDKPIPLRRADLLSGHDAALEAAIAWILEQRP